MTESLFVTVTASSRKEVLDKATFIGELWFGGNADLTVTIHRCEAVEVRSTYRPGENETEFVASCEIVRD